MKASLVRSTSHRLALELCWYCRCAALKLNIKLNEISNRTPLFARSSPLPACHLLFCVADDILLLYDCFRCEEVMESGKKKCSREGEYSFRFYWYWLHFLKIAAGPRKLLVRWDFIGTIFPLIFFTFMQVVCCVLRMCLSSRLLGDFWGDINERVASAVEGMLIAHALEWIVKMPDICWVLIVTVAS